MPVDHYENFPVASVLLPPRLRRPIEAIYRFARGADDIADEGIATDQERLEGLAHYREEIKRIEHGERTGSAAFIELGAVIREWNLPTPLFRDLLDAFAQDVVKKRYADFAELLDYCRRSANPVGRLLLHLVGCTKPDDMRRSDAICSALQLINFWQDVAVDWKKDRVYLPQDDLARFGVSEEHIAAENRDEKWAALLRFQVGRARTMLLDGASLVHRLPGRMGWEIRLTVQGGLRILDRIDAAHGDVFCQRPVLRAADWLLMASRAVFM